MKLKKGDFVNVDLKFVVSCLEHDEIDFDLEDLKKFLYEAIDIYKEEHDL